jgi:hypothetical protein
MLVINELLRCSPSLANNLTIWIGLPGTLHQTYEPSVQSLQGVASIRLFEAETAQKDPYFVKLGLANLVEQLCPEDQFLYLDYDHLVLGPLCLDACRKDAILVSSEIKQLDDSVAQWRDNLALPALHAGKKHFNNSLIFTSVARMRNVVGAWRQFYHRLKGLPPEMREEIAFCLAVDAMGEPLIAASHQLQEHFRDDLRESVLFHYGGATPRARGLKQFLKERAAAFCWEDFTSDCLSREHRILQEQLNRFRSLSV